MKLRKQAIYRELAEYYDFLYSWKDYEKESRIIKKLVSCYKKSSGDDLLEVGCGTGRHIMYLSGSFSVTAVDINNKILVIARKNNPTISFKQADMITLNLGKKFDVILCLYSSIAYVKTIDNLKKTIKNFAEHLKPDGVILIEPWYTKETYAVGVPNMTMFDNKTIKIAKICVPKIRGNLSIMDMNYLIAKDNQEIRHMVDRHEMGLFGVDETLVTMKKAGIDAKFLKNGFMKNRGLFIGVKK
ncbi:MAG: class I SAM-dependent methyltransferase [Candidatus Levybacteria bacterium]|nr:class I SAM-dependent methyltransferase [Candidatus Levybacteria bacterium]